MKETEIVKHRHNKSIIERDKLMCGIVGFTGNRQAAPILLDGLSKLEYRGYDSAGLAVRDGENLAQVVKAKGRLSNLIEKTDNGNALKGTCGIGHTRWATHGEPSQTNAHPHVSGNCSRSGSGTVESEVVGVHMIDPLEDKVLIFDIASMNVRASMQLQKRVSENILLFDKGKFNIQ